MEPIFFRLYLNTLREKKEKNSHVHSLMSSTASRGKMQLETIVLIFLIRLSTM